MSADGSSTAGSRTAAAGGRRRVVVVGGGISGLVAAWRLTHPTGPAASASAGSAASGGTGPEVVLLEASSQVGGKLRLGSVGGLSVDVGAESMLARRPEGVALVRELGLGQELVHPEPRSPYVLTRGELRRLPPGTIMGVPAGRAGLPALADLLTSAEMARVEAEPGVPSPALTEDVDVASWVAGRVGRAVVDRVVEPLLGGVYAGHTDQLSLQATVPALWQRARVGGTLLDSPAATSSSDPLSAGPVFAGLRGGVGGLPITLAERLTEAGVQVRTRTTVRGLRRTPSGWRLETGSAAAPSGLDADQVVLAVPAAAAARLLTRELPLAALELAAVSTAGVVVIAAAFAREQVAGLEGSGLLIPPVEGTTIKAATYSSAKWAWVSQAASDPVVIRLSAGRAGEALALQRDDDELTGLALADLNRILGPVLGRRLTPLDTLVTRWGGGLPQYAVGHLDRIARVRVAVAGTGVAVCGAAFDGVGVPACIAAADRAVADLAMADLTAGGPTRERTLEV